MTDITTMKHPMHALTDCTVRRTKHLAGSTFDALAPHHAASLQRLGGAEPVGGVLAVPPDVVMARVAETQGVDATTATRDTTSDTAAPARSGRLTRRSTKA